MCLCAKKVNSSTTIGWNHRGWRQMLATVRYVFICLMVCSIRILHLESFQLNLRARSLSCLGIRRICAVLNGVINAGTSDPHNLCQPVAQHLVVNRCEFLVQFSPSCCNSPHRSLLLENLPVERRCFQC